MRGGVLLASSMSGEEIHGTVAGRSNVDLSRVILNPLTVTDDGAHNACRDRGTDSAEGLIADELLLRT